ncbi:MAG: DNA repair protein RadA [Chloroflexi bacterium]|nr:MAG: DNA repair protein RadA [Chloroflexota bacterium]TMD64320.1 MAG: DNA repair protein RadA [Chloroflexota bacterium]
MKSGSRTIFACQECGNQSSKWLGRCPECGNWNSYVEEQVRSEPAGRALGTRRVSLSSAQALPLSQVRFAQANRLRLPMREVNQVLGGGIVPGSLVLVGGDPGIGKSTLLLQLAHEVASTFGPVLYVSGEESVQQLKLRAQRLGVEGDRLMVLAENDLDAIIEQLETSRPMLAVIDSIQTVFLSGVTSAPGSVSQVRECAGRLMLLAKSSHIPIFLVGHVNKEGAIAGPRVLEHVVDTVLYLEGERHHSFRILRSQKNRFGSTDEIGVFEMRDSGMHEISDPSRAFLQDRSLNEVGNVVHVALEGSRPLLVELQSLTTPSRFGAPRRSVNGIDLNRLHMLVAVLERRAHLSLGEDDVFINVAGGVRLTEPAADLAVALAIASNKRNRAAGGDLVAIGELGLSGEVRRVSQLERRLIEAHRLGFKRALIPAAAELRDSELPGMTVTRAETISDAIDGCFG